MESLSARDLRIFREESRAFCGLVKIPLDKLELEYIPGKPRKDAEEKVAGLVSAFQMDRLRRRESDSHVHVLISPSVLPEIVPTADGDLPWFEPVRPLTCLDGHRCVEAARRFLDGEDRWWSAKLYLDDLSEEVKNEFRERDPDRARYYNGDILRQIRIATLEGDDECRDKWLAKLSPSMRNWVNRLDGQPRKLIDSLDALIPFVGLWPDFQIGTLPRLLNLHCPEEMTRYLRRMRETLTYIMGEIEGFLLDPNTIHHLEGRCPARSLDDREYVRNLMHVKEIFPGVRDEDLRLGILNRICLVERMITSFHTFLEDTKYLEPCSKLLKKVSLGKCKGSLSQHFSSLHDGRSTIKVQTSEFTFEDRTLASGSYASWLSYRMVWLLTFRHFPVMGGKAPRTKAGRVRLEELSLQLGWWVDLSLLATDCGYKQIRRRYRDRKAADISMIEDCIRSIRPTKYYSVGRELIHRKATLIYQLIGDFQHVETAVVTPALTSDEDNSRPNISDKCGRPYWETFEADERYLFVDHIYSDSYDTTPRRHLTSFAITRDIFHNFFGTAEDDLDHFHLHILSDSASGGVNISNNAVIPPSSPNHPNLAITEDLPGPPGPQVLSPPTDPVNPSGDPPGPQIPLSLLDSTSPGRAEDPQVRQGRLTSRRPSSTMRRSRSPQTRHSSNRRSRSASSLRPLRERRASSQNLGSENATVEDITTLDSSDISEERPEIPMVPRIPSVPAVGNIDIISSVSRPPIYIFTHGPPNGSLISMKEASRLLFRTRNRTKARKFNALTPARGRMFCVHQADPNNRQSMVRALQLSSRATYLATGPGKRLRLTAPITILEEAHTRRCDAVIVAPRNKAVELIRQFEDYIQPDGVLSRSAASTTGSGTVPAEGKPMAIEIWLNSAWQILKKRVSRTLAPGIVGQYMRTYPGVSPHDWEGSTSSIETCFDDAQNEVPPTIYLCTPSEAASQLPLL